MSDNFQVKWEVSFTRIPNWLLTYRDSDGKSLSPQVIKTYFALASFADNQTMEAYPSQQLLAERADISVRSIQRYIKELADLDIIRIFKAPNQKDKWFHNIYQLSVNPPESMQLPEVVKPVEVTEEFDLGVASNGRKRTPNDEIWDAFEEYLGTSPKGDKINAGKWMAGCKRLASIYAENGVGIDQYKILTMTACAAYVTKFKDEIPLNPMALASNWENIQPKKYSKERIEKITAELKYSEDLPQGVKQADDGRIVLDG
jgi:hypothetical protein